jgi:hypothetical protein
MDIQTVFGSKSLTAGDLQGKEFTLSIADVQLKEFDEGPKLIITFRGAKKSLVCNRINAAAIASMYGSDTDEWIGKSITLFPTMVPFKGSVVNAIRVKPSAQPQPQPQQPARQHVVENRPGYQVSSIRPSMKDGLEAAGGVADDVIPF